MQRHIVSIPVKLPAKNAIMNRNMYNTSDFDLFSGFIIAVVFLFILLVLLTEKPCLFMYETLFISAISAAYDCDT